MSVKPKECNCFGFNFPVMFWSTTNFIIVLQSVILMYAQDEYEELLRYAVVTPKPETPTRTRMQQLSTSHLSGEGRTSQRKDDRKSQHPAGNLGPSWFKKKKINRPHISLSLFFWQKGNLSSYSFCPHQVIGWQKDLVSHFFFFYLFLTGDVVPVLSASLFLLLN